MSTHRARTLADAVMMEGYALYPYRASAPKNRYRWTFGVLAPQSWSESGGCEPWWLEAQLLVAGDPTRIHGELRFFQIERRRDWDEGITRAVRFELGETAISIQGWRDADRERRPLTGRIVARREVIVADRPLSRITIRVENTTPFAELGASRDNAVASAFASTHLLVTADGGELLSAIDPPSWAAGARCKSVGTYPTLVDGAMLCAPFILYDHPQLAPESAGDMCDATEIDELLVLRTRTMTEAEQREARATDPRTRAIVDRALALGNSAFERLHGAQRHLDAGEMIPRDTLAVGRKVRLRQPTRPTDAQDLLYAGHTATVVDLREDVDGTMFYAVTIDDDPAAELHDWYGRYHYYRSDEIEPL